MYIKEIKINGFKSFADKVNLELGKNFTGIVGPNGSGKSNIVDAIKWVLGEQSVKTLRGSSGMTDVIFNGSKSRESSKVASVTLVFDNNDKTIPIDFTEVSVKRRVYATGENEYFLNNEKCRLKDITNLFVDSFSSKESFNIIPQNKIDEILSDKSESRRIIFEEAAGVLKYKRRKEESLRKLSSTHDNLDRINMIIEELKERVTPLERDSLKAKEYNECKSKLESVEVALLTKDITIFNETYQEKKLNKEKMEEELSSLNTTSSKTSSEVEKLKLDLTKIEDRERTLQSDLIDTNNNLSSLQNKLVLLKERSKYDKTSSDVKTNLVSLKENELIIKNEIKALELDIVNNKEEELNLDSKIKTLSNEYNVLNKKYLLINNEYNDSRKREFEIKNKISLLEHSIANMDKVPYGVRSILNNPSLTGIDDMIGNIMDCSEEYSTMLDVSLGASSTFVIVDNDEAAKEAIRYLKDNNKGRVTFFPINVIKPKTVDPATMEIVNGCSGFIGLSSSLVNYDKKYYNVVMNVLGNIIVADNINNALQISKRINHKYRVVTLSGEILHVGGSLTGGSINKGNSSVADRYELVRLQSFLKNLDVELRELETKIIEEEYNLNVIKESIYKTNIENIKVKEILTEKNKKIDEEKELLSKTSEEIKTLSTSSKEKLDKESSSLMESYYKEEQIKNEIEQEIKVLSKKREDLSEVINEKEIIIKKSNNGNNDLINKIHDEDVEIVKLGINIDSLLTRLSDEYSLTYEAAASKYELTDEIESARSLVNDLKKKIKSLGNINLGSIEEYERVNKRYTFLTSQKEDLVQAENNLLEIISDMDNIMIDKFSTTFDLINREFNKVFVKLFGGGEAHLKLTDPSNILETGIEIIAIPPGKKFKTLSLLSGGEKALTAVTLLFAVMNLKQVPFAILDEVESALDEANVEKFGQYLNNYKGKTQLLIITHKKKTMEFVDLLYGVTMQESGVSKIVSVELDNLNK